MLNTVLDRSGGLFSHAGGGSQCTRPGTQPWPPGDPNLMGEAEPHPDHTLVKKNGVKTGQRDPEWAEGTRRLVSPL